MTKIYINYNSLEQNVLIDVNSSLDQLNKSINEIGTIGVPYNFEYAKYVKNIFDKNNSTYNKLLAKREKVKKIISAYKLVEQNNITLISNKKNDNKVYRKNIVN